MTFAVSHNDLDYNLFTKLIPLVQEHLKTLGVEHSRDSPDFLLRVYDTAREHKKQAKDALATSTLESVVEPIVFPVSVPPTPVVPHIQIAVAPLPQVSSPKPLSKKRLDPLDVIYKIVSNEKGPMRLHDLKMKFTIAVGVDPAALLGTHWVTCVKNDPRLHCDGRLVFTKTSVVGTVGAAVVARYNITALYVAADVNSFLIGEVCHLAGVCIACKSGIGFGECECTNCHHPSHGQTSVCEHDWRMRNSPRGTGNVEHVTQRRQVLQILKLLGVGTPESHIEVAHWLGICNNVPLCVFCDERGGDGCFLLTQNKN